MIGLGLGILWVGYTAFAVGRVYAKGVPITFSAMVLPKNRAQAVALVRAGDLGLNTSILGNATLQYLQNPGAKP